MVRIGALTFTSSRSQPLICKFGINFRWFNKWLECNNLPRAYKNIVDPLMIHCMPSRWVGRGGGGGGNANYGGIHSFYRGGGLTIIQGLEPLVDNQTREYGETSIGMKYIGGGVGETQEWRDERKLMVMFHASSPNFSQHTNLAEKLSVPGSVRSSQPLLWSWYRISIGKVGRSMDPRMLKTSVMGFLWELEKFWSGKGKMASFFEEMENKYLSPSSILWQPMGMWPTKPGVCRLRAADHCLEMMKLLHIGITN